MIIQTKISFKDYLSLMFKLAYRKPVLILLLIFDFLMILWVVLYYVCHVAIPKPTYAQFLTILLITIVQPSMIFFTVKRNYKTSRILQEEVEIEFTTDKLKIKGDSFYIEYNWNKTFKIVELDKWVLIYQNTFAATVIPKRSFTSNELEKFKLFIQSIPNIAIHLKNINQSNKTKLYKI